MPSSVMGRRISGSMTPARASVTCSGVGSVAAVAELMPSCYGLVKHGLAGPRVQDEPGESRPPPVEHAVQRAGQRVERPVADALAAQPVVLDETQHRGLVGERAIDVVAP